MELQLQMPTYTRWDLFRRFSHYEMKKQTIVSHVKPIVNMVLDMAFCNAEQREYTIYLPKGKGRFMPENVFRSTHYEVSAQEIVDELQKVFVDSKLTLKDNKVTINWSMTKEEIDAQLYPKTRTCFSSTK